MSEIFEQLIPKDRTGDNGRRPYKARVPDSLIIDQFDRGIEAELTRPFCMPDISENDHLSLVTCGHVVSGKSTTTGRLLFEVGGIPERELDKLKLEADMDRQKEEWGHRLHHEGVFH